MTEIKLLALDGEDLEVISAHVQDAIVRVGDMGFAKSDNRFALLINRFVWEKKKKKSKDERRRAALHFDNVSSVKITGIEANSRDGVLELLSITFAEGELPSGEITLTFAGGGEVVLKVDIIEARLADLGAAWAAKARPDHKNS